MLSESLLNNFRGRNILVTGGTGLIGRHIVHLLCEAGGHVKSVSLDKIKPHPAAEQVEGDLTDFGFCRTMTKGMDYVFHVAGIKGSIEVTKTQPASFFVPLLMFNTNVLEASRLNKVQKLVYTSSIGAYPSAEVFRESAENEAEGPPMDMFPGWAKRMAEMQIRAYKIQYGLNNFAIVRPCNVYGPGDNFDPANAMVVPSLLHRIFQKEDPVVIWGDGAAVRDFAYAEDVAEGIILALHHGTAAGYVNLGSGTAVTIKELVETLHSFLPFNYRFDATKPSGFPKRVMDISLARKLLGYNPTTTLRKGLQKTWDWYVQHQDEHLKRLNYFRKS